jgi:TPP-dependent pyruvate/acetoin dehydrogenase alpha subunit
MGLIVAMVRPVSHRLDQPSASSEPVRVREPAHGRSILELCKQTILLRALDSHLVAAQQAGEMAYYASCAGRIAMLVGANAALSDGDWIAPGQRDVLVSLLRGASLAALCHHMLGTADDAQKGRQRPNMFGHRGARLLPVSGAAGGHLPQAVGFAWSAARRREDLVVLACCGDGGFLTGEFHNGANFAGVMKAGVVFLTVNAEHPADIAQAYGFSGSSVDGTSAVAVRDAVAAACDSARAGHGPTLVDAQIPRGAEDEASLLALWAMVPADPAEKQTSGAGTRTLQANLEAEAREQILAAYKYSQQTKPPELETLLEGVYGQWPSRAIAGEVRADSTDVRGRRIAS